mgnify:CR=1 FL=1
MKKSELKHLIKEEIQKILNEDYRDEVKDFYGDTLTEKELRKILKDHDSSYDEYVKDIGGSLDVDKLLDWLGY